MSRTIFILIALLLCVPVASRAAAQPTTQPGMLDDVTIVQRLGERVPLDLSFVDEAGRAVRLRDLMHGRPVILTLVYYQCPSLCTLTLNQLTRSLNGLSESAGERFDVITVSFDPRETPDLAAAKKAGYLRAYRRPSAAGGWHFLTGDADSIQQLARAVGFHYRWDEVSQQFVHASAVMVLTPEGQLSRYFLGMDYPPNDLRAALNDAGRGAIAPPAEPIYFYCFKYDAATGTYGLIISRALRVLAVVTVLGICGLVYGLHRVTLHRARLAGPEVQAS